MGTLQELIQLKKKNPPQLSLSLSSPSIHRMEWTFWVSPPSMIGCCWTQCYANCVPVIADVGSRMPEPCPDWKDSIIFYMQRNFRNGHEVSFRIFVCLRQGLRYSQIPRLFSNLWCSWRWPWSSDPPASVPQFTTVLGLNSEPLAC